MATAKVQVVSEEDYLPARKQLLEKEKAWIKAKDELTKERQKLPIVEVTKSYTFTGLDDSGKQTQYSLSDLFHGRRQLIIYHAMFDPSWDAACPSCTVLLGSMNQLSHLNSRNTSLVVVSRAPIDKIAAYRARMGFNFLWVSSEGSDFNYDYYVTVDESKGQDMYNFRSKAENVQKKMPWFTEGEQPGHSSFIMGSSAEGIGEDGKVYHTYSSYARAGEQVVPTFTWLDMTPLGRQDGISGLGGLGFRRWDEYNQDELQGNWKN